jgi:hypothetical protein
VDVAPLDFRVMAPVSVRTEQERGTLGNRISVWMVPMPLGEPDPIPEELGQAKTDACAA